MEKIVNCLLAECDNSRQDKEPVAYVTPMIVLLYKKDDVVPQFNLSRAMNQTGRVVR